jgi:hypothetical protein
MLKEKLKNQAKPRLQRDNLTATWGVMKASARKERI